MSYDLNFWRYKSGVSLDHQEVYRQLCEGITVDRLESLPIDHIHARVREVFSDWDMLGDMTYDGREHGGFQLFTTPQFFRVDCYEMDGELMNRFIEIANEFLCPLYDPQLGRRFDGT